MLIEFWVAMQFSFLQHAVIGHATIAICFWEGCNSKNVLGGKKMQDVTETNTNCILSPYVA